MFSNTRRLNTDFSLLVLSLNEWCCPMCFTSNIESVILELVLSHISHVVDICNCRRGEVTTGEGI